MSSSPARVPFQRAIKTYLRIRRRPFFLNIKSLLRFVPFAPLDINCLYFLEYVGLPPQNPSLIRGRAEVRRGTLDDLEGLTRCQDKRLVFLNRFKANDHCAVAVVDGRIVGYQWFCDKPLYVEERYSYPIEVPPDAVYEYDIFILPEHRLMGLWFKFHCLYLRELMERLHRRRVIGMVDYGLHLSMHTHLRFGFRLFRQVVVLRAFGRSICLERTLRGDKTSLPRWVSGRDVQWPLASQRESPPGEARSGRGFCGAPAPRPTTR